MTSTSYAPDPFPPSPKRRASNPEDVDLDLSSLGPMTRKLATEFELAFNNEGVLKQIKKDENQFKFLVISQLNKFNLIIKL